MISFVHGLFANLWPALVPSWRFFDQIGPSPRIDFAWTSSSRPDEWQEFRPVPPSFSIGRSLLRLFWNPDGNDSLYLISCAEKLLQEESATAATHIFQHIARARPATNAHAKLSFRIRLIHRRNTTSPIPMEEIVFVSEPRSQSEIESLAT